MITEEEIDEMIEEFNRELSLRELKLKVPTKGLFIEDDELLTLLSDIKKKDIL